MYRLNPTDCDIVKKYVFNSEKFCIKKGKKYVDKNLNLKFTPGFEKEDNGYKTIFGPSIYHDSVVYKRSNHNLARAMGRLYSVREPDDPFYEAQMSKNQREYESNLLDAICEEVRERLLHTAMAHNMWFDLQEYVELPGPKRQLRMQTLEYELSNGTYLIGRTMVNIVETKVKSGEYGKFGKVPRMYASLGPASILAAGHIIQYFKDIMAQPIFVSGDRIVKSHTGIENYFRFIGQPTKELMVEAFSTLYNNTGVTYIYFSDDSVVSFLKNGRKVYYNVDIKSCDSSHTEMVFCILMSISMGTPFEEYIRAAINQCSIASVVTSYVPRSKEFIIFEPLYPVLYSGSTLTTLINNIAQFLLFSSITESVSRGDRKSVV